MTPNGTGPNPNAVKMAAALRALQKLQDKHHGVVESKDLSDEQRDLLVGTGFLKPVLKGWFICGNPKDLPGDTTAWYASYWPFLSGYLTKRFGKRYCLNPEASLLLHTGNTTVPRQVTVVTKQGGTQVVKLPFETSVLVYPDEKRVPKTRADVRGLQVWPVAEALCLVGPQFFTHHSREAEIALAMVRDPSELLTTLLAGEGMPTAASRLAGAMAFVGRTQDSAAIVNTMKSARVHVQPKNPFELEQPTLPPSRERSPYILRLRSLWSSWRQVVIDNFPPAPGLARDIEAYVHQVEERYRSDAYNSLSIEGYQVTEELIERVAKNGWDPENNEEDNASRDAMAARGYFQAFGAVKESIRRILVGGNPGYILKADHREWYSELFGPAVAAGILKRHQLAGYRTGPIFIRNSMHTPLPRDALLDSMEELFRLIAEEPEASVRAVLGHHLFVFIHPYFDGNGRIGRFMMNALLASGGYPWTVVRVARRQQYMDALELASVKGDIAPLTRFLAEELQAEPEARGAAE
ncbi:Fic family protein [Variovorax sp. LjRoot178]|uniref:Fic family protein n=1 Tax=Variovorax sp. LjRoot178 TaxID=3342277 RepID=UPI003ECFEEEF